MCVLREMLFDYQRILQNKGATVLRLSGREKKTVLKFSGRWPLAMTDFSKSS